MEPAPPKLREEPHPLLLEMAENLVDRGIELGMKLVVLGLDVVEGDSHDSFWLIGGHLVPGTYSRKDAEPRRHLIRNDM